MHFNSEINLLIDREIGELSIRSNVNPDEIRRCEAPTLVMAGEKDCLFPAGLVLPQAEKNHTLLYHIIAQRKRPFMSFDRR